MLEKYFDEFRVTEQELKEEIYSTLKSLNTFEPEQWTLDLLECANPHKPSQEIFSSLINAIPELPVGKMNLSELELIEALRLTAIQLTLRLNRKRLNYLFIKQLYMECSELILAIRYIFATEVLAQKLNRELRYDEEKIVSILTTEAHDRNQDSLVFRVVKAASEEIGRLFADDSAKQYAECILDFERAFEKYIEDNYYAVLRESFFRIANEAMLKNINILDSELHWEKGISKTDIREMSEQLLKAVRQNANRRLEIKKGGARKRKGFTWTDERKISFYKQVESLPRIITVCSCIGTNSHNV